MIDYKYKTKPFKHQDEDFLRSRDMDEFALFLEMGLGKSKIVVDNAAWLYATGKINAVFILGNKGSYRNWVTNELPVHMPDYVDWVGTYWDSGANTELKKSYDNLLVPLAQLKVFVMNIEALAFDRSYKIAESFVNCHKTLMVIDESTTIKNRDAKRTKAAVKIGRKADYRRILTGSPVTNNPLDLYSQANFLNPHLLGFSSYYTFRAKYADMVKITAGNRAFTKIKGYKNLEELKNSIRHWSSRRTKDECLDLPEKIYQTYEVELTAEQLKHYKTLKEKAMAELNGKLVSAPIVLTKLLRLHQLICGHLTTDDGKTIPVDSNRMKALMEVLDEASGKVIIWANYRSDIAAIEAALKSEYGAASTVVYFGDTSTTDREEAVKRFQNDPECKYFVGNAQTGGFGITLTAASNVVYYSNSYNLEHRLQSEDRAHRIGQKNAVTYVDLIAPRTVDEKIVKALRAKKMLSAQVLGDEWKEWLG
jgi:SNF2 family DNA or RNA helicase